MVMKCNELQSILMHLAFEFHDVSGTIVMGALIATRMVVKPKKRASVSMIFYETPETVT